MNFAPTDEQKMVRKFAEAQIKPIAADLDRTNRHPEEICRQLGEVGLMGDRRGDGIRRRRDGQKIYMVDYG